MHDSEKYIEFLQCHSTIVYFDYESVVDWATELVRNGIESEHVLTLASYLKVDAFEDISFHISGALRELGLEEKHGVDSFTTNVHYHAYQILEGKDIKWNLEHLRWRCFEAENDKSLMPFYYLDSAWYELERRGVTEYIEGATPDNIEEKVKEQAQLWIDVNIHGKVVEPEEEEVPKKKSLWDSIWRFWGRS